MNEVRSLLLAAGTGSRLLPLTEYWPKCLMPIKKIALLEYWLSALFRNDLKKVIVNIHHHKNIVDEFLSRENFNNWVDRYYEPKLLGTAKTFSVHSSYFEKSTTMLIHADNWCHCNFADFIYFHQQQRPKNTLITMMTFNTQNPENCGIVELDNNGIVNKIHEKKNSHIGNIANAAVYLIEPEIIDWLKKNPNVTDFSTEVLPNFLGQISTWHNNKIHRDIGEKKMLIAAQNDPSPSIIWRNKDKWQLDFEKHDIQNKIFNKD
tara:strand:+ start:4761 stop:5549 length:789 start_codon:yes stop_codon:yes gene_type:complete